MKRRSAFAIAVLLIVLCRPSAGKPEGDPAGGGADVHAGPRVVLIIRHAEKPDDPDDPNLAPKGRERAAAMAHGWLDRFPRPDVVIATARSKRSNRPVETVEPLAGALHEHIEAAHKDADFAVLAHDVLAGPQYAGKVVLICWHHGKIPGLARALGAAAAPEKWDPAVYDRVWEIDYIKGIPAFHDHPEHLLPGDSPR